MTKKQLFRYAINLWRLWAPYIVYKTAKEKDKIKKDIAAWNRVKGFAFPEWYCCVEYLLTYKEFRNLFLHRAKDEFLLGICEVLFPPLDSLYLACPKIGGGMFIQHGFSTILAAKEVGENCWLNQQVTVGYKGEDAPIIGNNVSIYAGAIIVGACRIDDNASIGAGAVVVKDVPAYCVVAGNPAKVIKSKRG